jgi:SAM-dependent methyltransferase
VAPGDGAAQGPLLAHEVRLANELLERSWAHAGRERLPLGWRLEEGLWSGANDALARRHAHIVSSACGRALLVRLVLYCGPMADEPLIWHYGLMAERWGEFLTDAPEAPFFLRGVERFGQPVLDLACGAGRILVPLLAAGVDVDGCDISPDMLDECRRAAERTGHVPALFAQPMHRLELPRRYRTIYLCDSFGLAGSRDNDLETLRRCREHLEDGGALIFGVDAEYTSPESWDMWLPAQRRRLPEPWPIDARSRTAADGTEHNARFRYLSIDPIEQTYTREVRLEKWRDGSLLASEEYVLRGNMYLRSEVALMLRVAGFSEISVLGDYTDAPATADHEKLIFIAIRGDDAGATRG